MGLPFQLILSAMAAQVIIALAFPSFKKWYFERSLENTLLVDITACVVIASPLALSSAALLALWVCP